MEIINENKLYVEKLTNTLIVGSTGSGKSVMACKLIDYCINNNYKIALVDPKLVTYYKYAKYNNLVYKIARNSHDYDDLADFLVRYDSKEKLYLFIDEYCDVVNTSKKLVEVINLKKDNICVIACAQNPYMLKNNQISSFDYEIVLSLAYRLKGKLVTNIDTKDFKPGEFIIKDIKSGIELDKISNLEVNKL